MSATRRAQVATASDRSPGYDGRDGFATSFRQELDSAWTVRFGPLPREQMRAVLDHFAW
jgi:hypothetical protein